MAPVCYVVRQNRLNGWRHQHNQLVADLHRLTTPLNLAGVVAYKTNDKKIMLLVLSKDFVNIYYLD